MIPDWKLERYRLGELTPADHALIAQALADEPAVRERLAALDQSDRAIRAAYPALPARSRPAPREAEPPSPARWLVPVLALAAAAVLALVFMPRAAGPDDILMKGDGPVLHLFRLADPEHAEQLVDGARVKPHDLVQVAVALHGAKHLVIVSVDGAGHTTLHWPLDGNSLAPVGFKAVPQSFELDEAPGFERFFLVTCDTPLSPQLVLEGARRAGRAAPLEVPGQVAIRSLLLDKGSP
ncbi:MAG: ActD-like protein [Archangiaceae bacterium]|nr:ActD-like protein [Archangiaceae bacterium]